MIIANYSISPDNYNRRTPVTLKKVADILLATILVVDPIMLTIPDFSGKEWLIFGWNMFVALFKLISKLVADADTYKGMAH